MTKQRSASRSMHRFKLVAAACLALAIVAWSASGVMAAPREDFSTFIQSLWPEAKAEGVSRRTFDAACAGVRPD